MTRPITLVGAASSIGIRPYDDGTPRGLDRAPAVLRRAGLRARLHAQDSGDVLPEPYRDFVRPIGRPRNEDEMLRYSAAIADRVAEVIAGGRFPLLLGGDCGIVLGALWGVRRTGRRRVGLAYIDGHADFASPEESRTGSVASMCLALATGRGDTPLARLVADGPLVSPKNVALVGRRDEAQPWYGNVALAASGILDVPHGAIAPGGYRDLATGLLARLTGPDVDGFWIHLDVDVLSPLVMPAVDSPEPGGPAVDELVPLVAALASHPRALGMELTIYDPNLDPDESCAARLVDLLERALVGRGDDDRPS